MSRFSAAETHFAISISARDPVVASLVARDAERQRLQLEMIAPKNYMSRAVREAMASVMTFTSVEGHPGRRYHAGVAQIDELEKLAARRAIAALGGAHANVQPHSGTQANQVAYFAFLEPGDRVLSLDLGSGGHLSHGLRSNMSGRWFDTKFYGLKPDGRIDYEQMRSLAMSHRPKLIIVGGSSYPRAIEFEVVAEIARESESLVLADIAHFSGLIAGGVYPNPFPHADIVTTTTNKSLRGPRGGAILSVNADLGKRVDAAVFPGVQGGPLPEMITAKAVAFGEAAAESFGEYARCVLENARAFAGVLMDRGLDVLTGGTDTPLIVVDLRRQGLTGNVLQQRLERAGLTCNRNLVPNDPTGPQVTSGLRFGTSALTTRGLGPGELVAIAEQVAALVEAETSGRSDTAVDDTLSRLVYELTTAFPVYRA